MRLIPLNRLILLHHDVHLLSCGLTVQSLILVNKLPNRRMPKLFFFNSFLTFSNSRNFVIFYLCLSNWENIF